MRNPIRVFCIILCIAQSLAAYSQKYQWLKGGGGVDHIQTNALSEQVIDMCTDANGNVYTLGRVGSHDVVFDTFHLALASNPGLGVELSHIMFASFDCNGKMRFAKYIESNNYNSGYGLVYSAGKIYVAGELAFGGKKIGYDATFSSIHQSSFLAKFDTSGQYYWTRFIGPDNAVTGSGTGAEGTLAVDGQGNIHHIVWVGNGVEIMPAVIGQNASYDIKYDINGNLLSAVKLQMQDPGYYVVDAEIDKQTDIIYALFNRSPPDTNRSGSCIGAFTAVGNNIWLDTCALRTAVGRFVLTTGGLYITAAATGGRVFSFAGKILAPTLTNAPVFMKLDLNGSALWAYQMTCNTSVLGFGDIEILPDHTLAFLGLFTGTAKYYSDSITSTAGETWNPLLTIIDTAGNLVFWDQLHGNGQLDFPGKIVTDKQGSLYLGGMLQYDMTATGLTPYSCHGGNTDFYVAKYGYDCNCTGIPKPVINFNYTVNTQNNTVQFNGTGTTSVDSVIWFMGDGTRTKNTSFTHTYPGPGIYTVCAHTYASCGKNHVCKTITIPLSVEPVWNNIPEVTFYPNPTHNSWNVYVPKSGDNIRLVLYTVDGRIVKEQTLQGNAVNEVNATTLAAGLYYYRISSETVTYTGNLQKN